MFKTDIKMSMKELEDCNKSFLFLSIPLSPIHLCFDKLHLYNIQYIFL